MAAELSPVSLGCDWKCCRSHLKNKQIIFQSFFPIKIAAQGDINIPQALQPLYKIGNNYLSKDTQGKKLF